jgi:hypothetical protein
VVVPKTTKVSKLAVTPGMKPQKSLLAWAAVREGPDASLFSSAERAAVSWNRTVKTSKALVVPTALDYADGRTTASQEANASLPKEEKRDTEPDEQPLVVDASSRN